MEKPEVGAMKAQSIGNRPGSLPLQEKEGTEYAEVATLPQLEGDLINQAQQEDLEPILHWR